MSCIPSYISACHSLDQHLYWAVDMLTRTRTWPKGYRKEIRRPAIISNLFQDFDEGIKDGKKLIKKRKNLLKKERNLLKLKVILLFPRHDKRTKG